MQIKPMTFVKKDLFDPGAHDPLTLVELIATQKRWANERLSETEMMIQVPGAWAMYHMYFVWQEKLSALQFCCQFDFRVPNPNRADVHTLLTMINERLWLGHFDLNTDEQTPMFRHNLLMRSGEQANAQQIEDVMGIAAAECDRFYPAFQFVLWGNRSPEDAIGAALIHTNGRA